MWRMDFEQEGLLDGLEGADRDARQQLLQKLADEGVGLDELKSAVAEDRLALLPVERVLGGALHGGRHRGAKRTAGRHGAAGPGAARPARP